MGERIAEAGRWTRTVCPVPEPGVIPELADYGPVMKPIEIAQLLRINPEHLVALMRVGRFPGFRVHGVWRSRTTDIAAVMSGQWRSPQDTSTGRGQLDDEVPDAGAESDT